MRGFAGASLVAILAVFALVGLGCCLVVIPARTNRFLNEAFVVVPVVGGRRHGLKRAIATAVGATLIVHGVYFGDHVLMGGRVLWGRVSTST
ncbi:hypothetical protein ACIP98_31395 [Streptomyces sp. NPDC088354]|uniref:hypothetical protein n=1 Tax=unclassified Streptomyces TaxID=2593676 RepID=UPI0029BD3C43|nr:hypothetical protein [Streptomyces sp. MI02-7b]MDX3075431.1 hypothetical protein [Streptomyces sp. MI02-7b]